MRQIYNSKIRETRLGWSQLFRISLLIMLFVMTFVFSSNAQNMTGTNKCYPSGSTAIGVDAQPSPYGTGYYYTLYRISTADVYNRIQYFAGPLSLPGAARDFTGLFNTPGQYKILIAPGPSTPSTGFTSSSIPGGYIAVSGEKWIYDAPTVETLDFSGTENTDYTIDANSWGVYCGSGNGSVTINTEGNYTYGSTWDVTYKLYKDAIAVDSITGNGSPKTWSGLADAEYYVTAKRDNCPENDMDNTKVVKTGIVTNTSTSLCYLTIQEAIDATPTVNTNVIKISNGSTSVYPENLYIDKEITLQPKLGDVPEIDGSIDIVADNVTIQDLFGVLSANPYAIKIHANADNYLIKNLSLINSVDKGIVLESGAGGGTIQGNTIMINTIGIDIAGSTAGVVNITGNFFEGNFTSDILNPVTNTNSVLITDNFFTDTPLAIDNYGSPMTITGNNFDNVPTAGTAINNTGANTMTINNNSFGGFNLNRTAITSNNALNAVSNWYGSAKGPIETANLCGEGWTVSSNITYSPWYGVNSMPGNSDTVTAFNATVASHTDNTCFGAALATITMNPTGGVTPYEYTYDGGANWVSYPSEIIDGLAHSGLAAGTYTITARSANGCEIAITPAVVITELPILSASVAHTDISCNGAADGTITITNPAGGSGYYKYRIDGGAHYSVSGSFGSLTNLTSYNVLIQDSLHKTCTISLVNPLDIIEPPVVAAPSTTTQTYEYDGSAYTVTATAALPGESIVWFANSTGGSSITAPAITNVGSVSAWAASYNGTCYSNDRTEVTVTITPKPLTIIGSTIASKIYDSFTTAGAVTPGTLSGFVFGETLSVTAVAADYPSANVNTYPATVITYTLVDATLPDIGSASNYSLANGSETGEITKANLEVTTSASDITYGDAAPTVTVNYT
ncbi:MAG: YDG domain-containing protein, partial [Bacteroidales bacterium]